MSNSYDLAIVGLGAWGASAAWRASTKGARVVGIDRYRPPHPYGSHTGTTRLARWSTSQDILYAPFTKLAFALWDELEAASGRELVEETGSILIGPSDHPARDIPMLTLDKLGMPYETLDARALATRFPALRCEEDETALYEPRGARIRSAEAISTMLEQAQSNGAHLVFGETMQSWSAAPHGVEIRTDKGVIRAGALVIATGAWTPSIVPQLQGLARAERQVLVFFRPKPGVADLPCLYYWQVHRGEPHRGYGAFETDGRFKIAFHRGGLEQSPDGLDRTVSPQEISLIEEAVMSRLPGIEPTAVDAAVCMYTGAYDEHWIIDQHPNHANVAFATACNGRGFRYAPAVGDMLTRLAFGEQVERPAELQLARFEPDLEALAASAREMAGGLAAASS